MKICEVLVSEEKHALKPIQAKRSSSRTIKPIIAIRSKPPLTLKQLRQKLLKLNVERAKEAMRHGREIEKWNRE